MTRVDGAGRRRTLAEAVAWRATARGPVVFTNGVFDLFHAGHVHLLESAAREGGSLVVALNSDASARRLGKGVDRPIVPLADRMAIVSAMACVDCVISFDEDTPATVIAALAPDVLVKGGDYRPDQVVGGADVVARGGRIVIVPLLPEHSATLLLERLRVPT